MGPPVRSCSSSSVTRQPARRVLHQDDGVDPEHVRGQRQAAQDVVGDASAGVAQHDRVAELETEHGQHVDPSVHAREHGKAAAGCTVRDLDVARACVVLASSSRSISVMPADSAPAWCHRNRRAGTDDSGLAGRPIHVGHDPTI